MDGLWLGDLEPTKGAILNHKEIAMPLDTKKAQNKPKPRKKRPD